MSQCALECIKSAWRVEKCEYLALVYTCVSQHSQVLTGLTEKESVFLLVLWELQHWVKWKCSFSGERFELNQEEIKVHEVLDVLGDSGDSIHSHKHLPSGEINTFMWWETRWRNKKKYIDEQVMMFLNFVEEAPQYHRNKAAPARENTVNTEGARASVSTTTSAFDLPTGSSAGWQARWIRAL